MTYELTAEMHLKNIIAESREVAQALNEFADNLESIQKKYEEPCMSCDRCNDCANEFTDKWEPMEDKE